MKRRELMQLGAAMAAAAGVPGTAQAQADDLSALYGQAKKEGKVVLYTSVPTFLLDRWRPLFQAKYPGIDLEYFRSGTGKVLARIDTEARANSLGGDVVWLADPTTFTGMVQQHLLLAYQPPEWAHLNSVKNPQGYFAAGRILVACLFTNAKAGGGAVKGFADLVNPALRGKVCMASPLISGSANIIDGALWKDPRFGWKYFEALKRNEILVLNDVPDVARAVATGERAAGISLTMYKYQDEFAHSPMKMVLPAEGTVAVASPVGVFAKAPHPAAAKLFYRFLLSPVAQSVLTEAGIYSVRSDVPAPTGLPAYAKLQQIEPDYPWIMAHLRENQQHWREMFGG